MTGLVDGLENDSMSARFSLRDAPPHRNVVVVAIDDSTFSSLRLHWPFKRSLHGRVIEEGETRQFFSHPQKKETEDYVSGRFS